MNAEYWTISAVNYGQKSTGMPLFGKNCSIAICTVIDFYNMRCYSETENVPGTGGASRADGRRLLTRPVQGDKVERYHEVIR